MANEKRMIDAEPICEECGLKGCYNCQLCKVGNAPTVDTDENFIYKVAFEIAVRCARELNGTPELKEAYQEAQKDNRALRSFMDFCLQKAAEEMPEQNVVEVFPVVRCKDCRWARPYERTDGETGYYCHFCGHSFKYGTNWERLFTPIKESDDFCSYGERRTNEVIAENPL